MEPTQSPEQTVDSVPNKTSKVTKNKLILGGLFVFGVFVLLAFACFYITYNQLNDDSTDTVESTPVEDTAKDVETEETMDEGNDAMDEEETADTETKDEIELTKTCKDNFTDTTIMVPADWTCSSSGNEYYIGLNASSNDADEIEISIDNGGRGVCKLILDAVKDSKFNKENIVHAALLHDMGNIIKFKLDKDSDLVKLKSEFIKRYGPDEHIGTIKILEEINVKPEIIELIQRADWPNLLKDNSLNEHNLLIYADMRVSPDGVTDLISRIDNLIVRNKAKGIAPGIHNSLKPVALELEQQIAKYIDPKIITEEQINKLASDLFETVIETKA